MCYNLRMNNKQKIALVLGGGSALGYAHIGVIQEMEEQGMRPDLIVGTSMGSIVGAYYALHGEVDSLIEVLKNTSALKVGMDSGLFTMGLVGTKKIEKLFEEVMGEATFSDCKIPLKINACDINSGENVVIEKGLIREAMRASMSIPGVFAPVVIDGRILVDGGLCNNLAVNLVPANYKIVAVKVTSPSNKEIFTTEDLDSKNPVKRTRMYFEMLHKSFAILMNRLEDHMVAQMDEVIYIEPDLRAFNFISFNKYNELIAAGREAAKKVFG